MYEPGTILALKEPKSTEDAVFPYDTVRVVGQSPINHGASIGSWEGADGQGVIVQPNTEFGSTLDEPYGKLRALYNVESIPEVVIEAPQIRVVSSASSQAGKTPEEAFEEVAGPKSATRVKTPVSPLDVLIPEPVGTGVDAPATPKPKKAVKTDA